MACPQRTVKVKATVKCHVVLPGPLRPLAPNCWMALDHLSLPTPRRTRKTALERCGKARATTPAPQ